MKLIVGLGNPGRKYCQTRHNIGFQIVEQAAASVGVSLTQEKFEGWYGELTGKEKILFLLPQTYMNNSGRSVSAAVGFFKIPLQQVLVVHDDVDFPLGTIKRAFDSRSAGNRGVQDVIEALGTQEFCRLRVGVGRPQEGGDVVDYVLSPFAKEDKESLGRAVEIAVAEVKKFIQEGSPL